MAFYILVLSVLPCSDAHNSCNENKIELTKGVEHNHGQDHDDVCSPFCICACCGTTITFQVISSPIPIVAKIDFKVPQKIAIRDFSIISCYTGKIWQPPKFNC